MYTYIATVLDENIISPHKTSSDLTPGTLTNHTLVTETIFCKLFVLYKEHYFDELIIITEPDYHYITVDHHYCLHEKCKFPRDEAILALITDSKILKILSIIFGKCDRYHVPATKATKEIAIFQFITRISLLHTAQSKVLAYHVFTVYYHSYVYKYRTCHSRQQQTMAAQSLQKQSALSCCSYIILQIQSFKIFEFSILSSVHCL